MARECLYLAEVPEERRRAGRAIRWNDDRVLAATVASHRLGLTFCAGPDSLRASRGNRHRRVALYLELAVAGNRAQHVRSRFAEAHLRRHLGRLAVDGRSGRRVEGNRPGPPVVNPLNPYARLP